MDHPVAFNAFAEVSCDAKQIILLPASSSPEDTEELFGLAILEKNTISYNNYTSPVAGVCGPADIPGP